MNKRYYNFAVTIIITLAAYLLTIWIFESSLLLLPFVYIISIRMLIGVLVFQTHTFAWSRAGSKSGILSVISGGVAGIIYTPVITYLFDTIGLRFLFTEWVIFHFGLLISLYSYRYLSMRKLRGKKQAIVYGAGKAADQVTNELENLGYKILWYIDDDRKKQKRRIEGKRIFSFSKALHYLKSGHKPDLCVMAILDLSEEIIKKKYERLAPYVPEIRMLPSKMEFVESQSFFAQTKELTVEDLLARHVKDLDRDKIANFIKGKIVMVTGAGGSIGSEIVRQSIANDAKQVILVDHSEINLYNLSEELDACQKCVPCMVSVKDKDQLSQIFEKYQPEIVIHAAAYKHVPLCESNIASAIENNVVGTKNVVDLCVENNVAKMVLISTDKAVRPTNVMGTTKRICELYAQNSNGKSNTDIVAVRFGNVLGSSGSVIPKFKQLIAEGKDLTVTDPNITRYFMLIPEACSLVLQAGALGKGGEIFILDMGDPIRIADLAQRMIDFSGKKGLKVIYTGLRPGEKLYEELLINDADRETAYDSILVASPTVYDLDKLNQDIDELLASDEKLAQLKKIVPEFNHNPGK